MPSNCPKCPEAMPAFGQKDKKYPVSGKVLQEECIPLSLRATDPIPTPQTQFSVSP